MAIRINDLRISLDDDISNLKKLSAKKIGVKQSAIEGFKIVKESIDARRKGKVDFIYSVELFLGQDEKAFVARLRDRDIVFKEDDTKTDIRFGTKKLESRPVIIGLGPAGLFAGLLLAKKGYKPIIFERGRNVNERTKVVQKFWNTGDFDPECNVQFGEGGAGTFSDGKLTTRIKDTRCSYVIEELVKMGAPSEILYNYKPHIGTDILKTVVANIRNRIIELGGDVCFSSRMTDIKIKEGRVCGLVINENLNIDCNVLILALGHSARDTIEMVYKKGIAINSKPFAVGFRVEHSQQMIDEIQFGKLAGHPKLKAADYRLAYHSKKYDRPCYSFCMCPGGIVVAAASEENRLVTNGMSVYARDGKNANSAIVCGVGATDFGNADPLSGMEFQRSLEEIAFKMGGGCYTAPVQRLDDFIKGKVTSKIGSVQPSYTGEYRFADLNNCLPSQICAVIKEGLVDFEGKIKGFGPSGDGMLTAVETRTSSPVRIDRNESGQSLNTEGLYPAGEGAGYAGGIISAAVDGIKISEEIMKVYAPFANAQSDKF